MAILFHTPWDNAPIWLDALRRALPDTEIRVWPEIGRPEEILFAIVWNLPAGALDDCVNLKGVCSLGAGVDHLTGLPPDVPAARLVDPLMADRMAEYVCGHVLHHHLGTSLYIRQQRERRWQQQPRRDARDVTVTILGLGSLGRVCARRLVGLGFKVTGWSRSPQQLDNVDTLSGEAALNTVLSGADMIVCLLPLTEETRGLLDAERLALLPRGAVVINCARGAHIVAADLIAALETGHLAGASLDVFESEPLPESHPYWSNRRIVVTPHVSSLSEPSTGALILADQYRLCLSGQEMRHLVDPAAGY